MEEILHTALTNALVASVFAILVIAITRVVRAPALARALWLLVLAKLVTPPIFVAPISFRSKPVERLLASSAENHTALLTDAFVQSGSLNTNTPQNPSACPRLGSPVMTPDTVTTAHH